jgi:hemolysin activation/secretion protein
VTLGLGATAGYAQTGASDSPKFEIREIKVDGNTLLPRDALDRAFAPFIGAGRDFGDVQRALEALEGAYTQAGFGAIQVSLPEQELNQGVVTFKVTESKIGKIIFEGNRLFDEANVRNSLPSLKEGQVPNVHRMGENLHLANENPAKQTAVILRNTERDGEVDAVVRVTEQNPLKFSLSLDNTGTTETGEARLGLGFQHSNLFNRDQVLTGQLIGSPTKADQVAIVGLGYRIPIYGWGDSFDITAGYSNVSSGTLLNLYSVSGKGTIAGLRYNMQLPHSGSIEHKLSFGLDYRAFRNDITVIGSGAQVIPDITLHPVSLTYAGLSRFGTGEFNYFLSAYRNLPGGNDGGQSAFDPSPPGARTGARAGYLLFRYGVNLNQSFANDWQMHLGLTGQETRDALVSGEQFGMGGFDNVRGFQEREVANDRGYRGNLELYTPDVGRWFGNNWRVRALGFYDAGRALRNQALANEITAISIASTGLGIRLAYANSATIRVDYAIVTDAGGTQGKGDARLHASFILLF